MKFRRIDPRLRALAVAAPLLAMLLAVAPIVFAQATEDAPAAPAAPPEEATDPVPASPTLPADQEAVAQTIFGELISPCCWTTTVATHGTGAAPRIMAEVRRMLAGGMTHQQILDHYVKQYGERILAKPRKAGFNLAVYWVPYIAILAGIFLIVTIFRQRRGVMLRGPEPALAGGGPGGPGGPGAPRPRPAPGSDDDYRRRIEDELRRSS